MEFVGRANITGELIHGRANNTGMHQHGNALYEIGLNKNTVKLFRITGIMTTGSKYNYKYCYSLAVYE